MSFYLKIVRERERKGLFEWFGKRENFTQSKLGVVDNIQYEGHNEAFL